MGRQGHKGQTRLILKRIIKANNMLPRDTRYRSTLSGGPYGVNPRRMPSMDFDIALQEAEFGVRPHDYPPYSPSPHPLNHMPMPYPPHHRYDEMVVYGNGNHSFSNNMESTQDLVRRTNLAVSLANHNVNPRSHVAQVHPMMCLDGGYPADFQTPMMIEDIKLLDCKI